MDTLVMPIGRRDHIMGPRHASALVEYGDYECPICGQAYLLVKALQRALRDNMCFVFRNFPLTSVHPHAEQAAEAAEAAGTQGRFWDMHDTLFENQHALEEDDLARYAAALELDSDRLLSEVVVAAYRDRVREDFRSGVRSGVNGTPTFFINGVRYDGLVGFETMLTALAEGARRYRVA